MNDALVVTDLHAGYGATEIIQGVSLSLAPGQCLGVLGRNGAGKTTLLSSIMGLATHLRGSVELDGKAIMHSPTHERCRAGLGFVPQARDIFASLTVEENLRAAARGHSIAEGLSRMYEIFPRLRDRARHGGSQLSGGEQQMLAIARALMGKPRLLLLDEPLEGLAPQIRDLVMHAIARMAQEDGIGCLLVEQHVDTVLDFAETVLILENGGTVFLGPSSDLRADKRILAASLGVRKI